MTGHRILRSVPVIAFVLSVSCGNPASQGGEQETAARAPTSSTVVCASPADFSASLAAGEAAASTPHQAISDFLQNLGADGSPSVEFERAGDSTSKGFMMVHKEGAFVDAVVSLVPMADKTWAVEGAQVCRRFMKKAETSS